MEEVRVVDEVIMWARAEKMGWAHLKSSPRQYVPWCPSRRLNWQNMKLMKV
jgi:hypothetical protein